MRGITGLFGAKALGPVLAVLFASSGAGARTMTFHGGILDGLRAEVPDDGRPASQGYFLPGVDSPRPSESAHIARIMSVLADARRAFQADRSETGAYPGYSGQRAPDESWTHFGGRLQVQCRVEAPYSLLDGRVRIGVVCGDRIAQFLMATFSGDEIASFEIDEAVVPNLLPTAGATQ
jgi:hypothetical protein